MYIIIATISMLLGMIGGLYFRISIVLFLFIFLWIGCIKRGTKKKKYAQYIHLFCSRGKLICAFIFFLFGYFYVFYIEGNYTQVYNKMPQEVSIVATVVGEKQDKPYKQVYRIRIDKIEQTNVANGKEMLLEIKKGKNKERSFLDGDKIHVVGTYSLPSQQRNYQGFDYGFYLKTKQLYGTITASKVEFIKHTSCHLLEQSMGWLAKSMKKKATELLPEESAGMVIGLLIGDKAQISDVVQEHFRESSLSHMLAVSGAHVSYLILGITFFLQKLRCRKVLINSISITILGLFIILTGATPSVVRACLMAMYIMMAKLWFQKPNILVSLAFPLCILLLSNPYTIFSTSLQLSYGGTIGILVFFPIFKQWCKRKQKLSKEEVIKASFWKQKRHQVLEKLLDMMGVTLSANLVVLPIMAETFQTISATFLISNLLASPILGITILLGLGTMLLSFICFPIAKLLAYPLHFFLQILMKIASITSKLPFSKCYVIPPPLWLLFLYFIGLFCLSYFYYLERKKRTRRIENYFLKKVSKFKRYRWKSCVVLIIVVFLFSILVPRWSSDLRIYFIDVGQGDSCLMVTPTGKRLLIDGGGSKDTNSFDVGKQVLLPYLLNRGVTHMDYMLFSHFDEDHCQGLFTIMEQLKVNHAIIGKQFENYENYQKFQEIAKKKKIKVHIVEAGQRIKIEKDLYFDVLWPSSENVINENSINNNSLVCKFVYKDFSILFTGDIEEIAEKSILEKYKNNLNLLNTTILKVAHHGSKSSSTQEFLDAVKPRIALIGVGENNTFGHPNQGVLERLQTIRLQDI